MTTQELSTEVKQQQGALSAYRNVDEMLKFTGEFGKEFASMGLCGVQKQSEGRVLALACYIKRMDPFDLDDRYHIIQGKLSMKPDNMLASLRNHGGDYEWVDDGTVTGSGDKMKGQATIKTFWRGKEHVTTYSMEDAYRAGLVKPKSGWDRNPDAMLRARAVTKAGRMHFPEVLKGKYAPEELDENYDGEGIIDGEVVQEEQPARTKAEVEQRRQEILGEEPEASEPDPAPAEEEIIDVESEPASEPEQSQLGEVQAADSGFDQAMIDLEETLSKCNLSKEALENNLRKAKEGFTSLEDLTASELKELSDKMLKKLNS